MGAGESIKLQRSLHHVAFAPPFTSSPRCQRWQMGTGKGVRKSSYVRYVIYEEPLDYNFKITINNLIGFTILDYSKHILVS